MACAREPGSIFSTFGNMFGLLSPRPSPELLILLNAFEKKLDWRVRNLHSTAMEDSICLPWMCSAIKSVREIHSDFINLATAVRALVRAWDIIWVHEYTCDAMEFCGVSYCFRREIDSLEMGHSFLVTALRNLDGDSQRARSSLDAWKKHISEKKSAALDERLDRMIARMLSHQPTVGSSVEGEVLMRAIYGIKVVTVSVFSIFLAAFRGSPGKLLMLLDWQVSQKHLWSKPFAQLQSLLNMEIRSSPAALVLKELEAVGASGREMHRILKGEADVAKGERQQVLASNLRNMSANLSQGLRLLDEEMARFQSPVPWARSYLASRVPVASAYYGVAESMDVPECGAKDKEV